MASTRQGIIERVVEIAASCGIRVERTEGDHRLIVPGESTPVVISVDEWGGGHVVRLARQGAEQSSSLLEQALSSVNDESRHRAGSLESDFDSYYVKWVVRELEEQDKFAVWAVCDLPADALDAKKPLDALLRMMPSIFEKRLAGVEERRADAGGGKTPGEVEGYDSAGVRRRLAIAERIARIAASRGILVKKVLLIPLGAATVYAELVGESTTGMLMVWEVGDGHVAHLTAPVVIEVPSRRRGDALSATNRLNRDSYFIKWTVGNWAQDELGIWAACALPADALDADDAAESLNALLLFMNGLGPSIEGLVRELGGKTGEAWDEGL